MDGTEDTRAERAVSQPSMPLEIGSAVGRRPDSATSLYERKWRADAICHCKPRQLALLVATHVLHLDPTQVNQ
jgi:hypothetical protein